MMVVALAVLVTSMFRSPDASLRRGSLLWGNSIETDVASFPSTPVAEQGQLVTYIAILAYFASQAHPSIGSSCHTGTSYLTGSS